MVEAPAAKWEMIWGDARVSVANDDSENVTDKCHLAKRPANREKVTGWNREPGLLQPSEVFFLRGAQISKVPILGWIRLSHLIHSGPTRSSGPRSQPVGDLAGTQGAE